MKSLLLLGTLSAFLAAPLMGSNLPVCGVANLATYETYGDNGCTVGTAFTFKDFEYILNIGVFANTVTANDILVTPGVTNGAPTFTFTANWGVNGGVLGTGTLNAVLGFRGVTSDALFNAFDSVKLITVGSNSTGVATNLVTEEDCVGGLLTGALCSIGGGTTANIGAQILGQNLGANAVVNFTSATSIDVIKTISLISVLGSDNLTSIGQEFGTNRAASFSTPEPMTMWSFGSGIFAIGLARHFRRHRT
jgi:hypothetical protein